eukprot:32792_1
MSGHEMFGIEVPVWSQSCWQDGMTFESVVESSDSVQVFHCIGALADLCGDTLYEYLDLCHSREGEKDWTKEFETFCWDIYGMLHFCWSMEDDWMDTEIESIPRPKTYCNHGYHSCRYNTADEACYANAMDSLGLLVDIDSISITQNTDNLSGIYNISGLLDGVLPKLDNSSDSVSNSASWFCCADDNEYDADDTCVIHNPCPDGVGYMRSIPVKEG